MESFGGVDKGGGKKGLICGEVSMVHNLSQVPGWFRFQSGGYGGLGPRLHVQWVVASKFLF